MKRFILCSAGILALALVPAQSFAQQGGSENLRPQIANAIRHDVSLPLRSIAPIPPERNEKPHEHPVKPLPQPAQANNGLDSALQVNAPNAPAPAVAATMTGSFDGVGIPNYGVNAAPPDTNGAAGTTQYVQWVNEAFAVYDKATGNLVYGPANGNTIWSGFGGPCQTSNDGDPIVQFDKAAKRWIMTQFAVSTTPYRQCVAVSTSEDATGSYSRYEYTYGTSFNDYPKLAVWPDAYYITYNMFTNGQFFAGSRVCAFDRAKMLAGAAATQQCVQLGTSYGGLLPSDLDGSAQPPAGEPNYLVNFGSNSLNVWKFHVDWNTPANSTLTGPTNIPVSSFSTACGGGTCIPQPGTSQQLDSLGDRLMYRLAYRNFGTYAAMVVNHSVKIGSSKRSSYSGVRWYELRITGGNVSVYQQGTFAPDTDHRWMGSMAMDKVGNIGLGYSKSSSTIFPSIFFTGRQPGDVLGTMSTESSIYGGSGSQLRTLNRWGDYSSLSVDPVDDCTMWYTTEYLKQNGTFNWSTRIGKWKFSTCN
jgi:hypothetical protein